MFKPYLNSPFHVKLAPPPAEAVETIAAELRRTFSPLLQPRADAQEGGAAAQGTRDEMDGDGPSRKKAKRPVRPVRVASTLAVGVNEVTRALEKNRLSAVLLAKEANPPILVRHLPPLAHLRGVPLCVLPGLCSLARETVGIPARVAIGILREQPVVDTTRLLALLSTHALQLDQVYKDALATSEGHSAQAARRGTYVPLRITKVNVTRKKKSASDPTAKKKR